MTNKLIAVTYKDIQGPGIQPTADSVSQLEKILGNIFGLLTVIGVVYFTVQIILAGYTLISSHGDPKELDTGKKRLTNNIIGLAIIVVAYGLGALLSSLLGMPDIFNLQKFFSTTKIQ